MNWHKVEHTEGKKAQQRQQQHQPDLTAPIEQQPIARTLCGAGAGGNGCILENRHKGLCAMPTLQPRRRGRASPTPLRTTPPPTSLPHTPTPHSVGSGIGGWQDDIVVSLPTPQPPQPLPLPSPVQKELLAAAAAEEAGAAALAVQEAGSAAAPAAAPSAATNKKMHSSAFP